MKPATIDASVIAAAFFGETHAAAATQILASGAILHTPDLLYAEVGNVVCKRRHRREFTNREGAELISDLGKLPLIVTPAKSLVADALSLAMNLNRTVYDCTYLALAVHTAAPLISCDRRLVNALASTPLAPHIAFIADVRN